MPAPHDSDQGETEEPTGVLDAIAAAAIRAPSGGNTQPWRLEVEEDSVTIRLAPERTSAMDVGFRASAVAVGAAAFNARVAAAARGIDGRVEFGEGDAASPLHATVRLAPGQNTALARLYRPMLTRETNRHLGARRPISAETIELLEAAANQGAARLQLLTASTEIERAAVILAAADRIRYLTQQLHSEMMSELRWPADGSLDSGIDVRSLELGPSERITLDLLRRPDVTAQLAEWDAGEALGTDTHDRVRASSALAVVTVRGHGLIDYARGGSAVEELWIAAQQQGLAVQPVSPPFLYARGHDELRKLSPDFATALHELQREFLELADTRPDEAQVLVLRLTDAPRPSIRSRRRGRGRA